MATTVNDTTKGIDSKRRRRAAHTSWPDCLMVDDILTPRPTAEDFAKLVSVVFAPGDATVAWKATPLA